MSENWAPIDKLTHLFETRELQKLQEMGGIEGVITSLNSSTSGLDPENLQEETRHELYGRNELAQPKTKSFIRLWLEAFNDTTLIILIVLAVVSLIIALAVERGANLSWLDGTAILATVIVVTLVTAINTYSQERQFQKLNQKQSDHQIIVVRGGVPTQISVLQLLVGDVFLISTGDVLPADGLCIESNNISCDEAAMTGESDLIKKNPETRPFCLCGCKVQTGFGKMIVSSVGMNTQFGILKQAVLTAAQERNLTPLQEKLDGLAGNIGKVGFVAAGITLLLLIIFWLIPGIQHPASFKTGDYWLLLVDYFIIAVSIIVMAVPEGLPLAVTIALAYSMKKMLKDNNLVRVLSSCETMGGATTICSDKTGTLTQNKMKVDMGFFNGNILTNLNVQDAKAQNQLDPFFGNILLESISLNSSGDIKHNPETDQVDYLGNVTECALLLFAEEFIPNEHYSSVRQRLHPQVIQTYPFSSDKKRMTVIRELAENEMKNKDDRFRVYTKGASEIVSGLCNRMYVNGELKEITPQDREAIDNTIYQMASKGLRTIAIAYNDTSPPPVASPSDTSPPNSAPLTPNPAPVQEVELDGNDQPIDSPQKIVQEDVSLLPPLQVVFPDAPIVDKVSPFPDDAPPEDDLILLAITGIKDPLRPEVPLAIEDCHNAHIIVRMVTGDNIVTAMHIAQECGIYDPQFGIAMEGPFFRSLSEEDRAKILPKLQVLARSSPIDKQILVDGLQKLGHVVAVTGDGTNDAPALSKADVGFAMGITGTGVAKDAAAIIITDDNFASIVKAVMWGRNVYDSIRKFIQFQLTINVSALIIAVIGAIFAITPLTAVQMLWVNIIMDTLAALALATELPTRELLQRKPYGKNDNIISVSMWRNIIIGTVYEVIVIVLVLFLWGPKAPLIRDPSDPNFDRVHDCSLLQPRDEISVSELMFKTGICRQFLMAPTVAVFSEQHLSFVFNIFIWMQVFNWVASRKCYNENNFFAGIFTNYMFIIIWFTVSALQVVIMLVPGIRDAFTIIPITGLMWVYSLAFGVAILPIQFLFRLIKAPHPFNGEVEIPDDPDVPAGVYLHGKPLPEGAKLSVAQPTVEPEISPKGFNLPELDVEYKEPVSPQQHSVQYSPERLSINSVAAETHQVRVVPTETSDSVRVDPKQNWKSVRLQIVGTASWKRFRRPVIQKKDQIVEEGFLNVAPSQESTTSPQTSPLMLLLPAAPAAPAPSKPKKTKKKKTNN
ncbi:ion-transporting P-type ATPase [Blattamonas nauphoetae]|uniref:Ion-transporting P-type ATPase n=1 Tax=Blattamonas nauphoetae TaxID=2049346 RepID=A0ABQ9YFF2_9EUKA|nr:ion-transporting P-type ATPase [Blattamonas nauphoetae]